MLITLYVALVVAAGIDVATHRIPNLLTFPLMLVGIVMSVAVAGAPISVSLIGIALAFAIHYTLWTLGIDAAGDAKLFMAIGAFLGWQGMVEATLWRLVLHIPFALIMLTVMGRWGNFQAAARWFLLTRQGRDAGEKPPPTYVPLGVVIALAAPLAVHTALLEFF